MDHGLHHLAHVLLVVVERQEFLPSRGRYVVENLEICHPDIDRALHLTTTRGVHQKIESETSEFESKLVGRTTLESKSLLSKFLLAVNVSLTRS